MIIILTENNVNLFFGIIYKAIIIKDLQGTIIPCKMLGPTGIPESAKMILIKYVCTIFAKTDLVILFCSALQILFNNI